MTFLRRSLIKSLLKALQVEGGVQVEPGFVHTVRSRTRTVDMIVKFAGSRYDFSFLTTTRTVSRKLLICMENGEKQNKEIGLVCIYVYIDPKETMSVQRFVNPRLNIKSGDKPAIILAIGEKSMDNFVECIYAYKIPFSCAPLNPGSQWRRYTTNNSSAPQKVKRN